MIVLLEFSPCITYSVQLAMNLHAWIALLGSEVITTSSNTCTAIRMITFCDSFAEYFLAEAL